MKANRRYYLHRVLKMYFNVNAHEKRIDIPSGDLSGYPERIQRFLSELCEKGGYNIQYTLFQN